MKRKDERREVDWLVTEDGTSVRVPTIMAIITIEEMPEADNQTRPDTMTRDRNLGLRAAMQAGYRSIIYCVEGNRYYSKYSADTLREQLQGIRSIEECRAEYDDAIKAEMAQSLMRERGTIITDANIHRVSDEERARLRAHVQSFNPDPALAESLETLYVQGDGPDGRSPETLGGEEDEEQDGGL